MLPPKNTWVCKLAYFSKNLLGNAKIRGRGFSRVETSFNHKVGLRKKMMSIVTHDLLWKDYLFVICLIFIPRNCVSVHFLVLTIFKFSWVSQSPFYAVFDLSILFWMGLVTLLSSSFGLDGLNNFFVCNSSDCKREQICLECHTYLVNGNNLL